MHNPSEKYESYIYRGDKINRVICSNCGKDNVIKKGKIKTKFGFRQFYYCKDCGKGFTASKLLNKTYGPKVIANAITYYNLGNTLDESAKLVNKRFKVSTTNTSVCRWIKEFKDICTYNKLRQHVMKNYGKENKSYSVRHLNMMERCLELPWKMVLIC